MPPPLPNPDGLFPSDKVVAALWDLPPGQIEGGAGPGWAAMPSRAADAEPITLVDAVLTAISPVVSALSAAGWQATFVEVTADPTLATSLLISVPDRQGSFSTSQIVDSTGQPGPKLIVQIEARPVPVPQGAAHAMGLSGGSTGWAVSGDETSLLLTLDAPVPGTGSIADALAGLILPILDTVAFVATGLGPRYGQISSAGLSWMLNPVYWFGPGEGPQPEEDPPDEIDDVVEESFMDLVVEAAKAIVAGVFEDTDNSSSDNTGADLIQRLLVDGNSLLAEYEKVEPTARTNLVYQQRAMERAVRNEGGDDLDARLKLVAAARSASFFDFCCMLVSTGLINPPLLSAPPIEVLQELEASDVEPLGFVSGTATGTHMGTAITLILYGQPCVTLRQLSGGLNVAPHILDNAAWELTGLLLGDEGLSEDGEVPGDAAFGIALTLGRGVSVTKLQCDPPYELDIYWTQMPSTIPLPQSMPVDLVGNAGLAPGDAGYESVDLCARGALNQHLQRMPAVFEGFVPDNMVLDNFSRQSPPMLVMSQMEQGAIKFEWFARGGSGPPGEPEPNLGESFDGIPPIATYDLPPPEEGLEQELPDPPVPPTQAPPQGTPEVTVIITPKTPLSGDFGFAMSIDYVRHKGADLMVPFYPELEIGEPLPWSYGFMCPSMLPLIVASQAAGGMPEVGITDTSFDRGVAHFRLWFAGDVQIDVSANAYLNQQFQMELVKIPEVLDLPENGTRLPCRRGYYEGKRGAGIRGLKTYHSMLDPEESDLPRWMELERESENGIKVEFVKERNASQVIFGTGFTQVQPIWLDAEWVIATPEYMASHPQDLHPYGDRQVHCLPGQLDIPAYGMEYLQLYADLILSFTPVVGDIADVAEFLWALYSGKDKWGNPQPAWVIGLMGFGALCPLVSNGMLKGVREIGGATVVGGTAVYLTTYQDGRAPPNLAKLWDGVLRGSDDAVQIERIGGAVGEKAFRDMSRAEKAQALADTVPLSELKAIALRAGVSVGDLFSEARMTVGMLLHPSVVDEAGDFVFAIDGMETAYWIWRNARADKIPAVPLSRLDFIASRKTSSGKWAAVAKAFNVPEAMPIQRVRNANPARGPKWPGRPSGVFDGFVTRSKEQIASRLKDGGAVSSILETLPDGSREIVRKYQSELTAFLDAKSLEELETIFSTSTELSPEEVLSVLGHMMQKADNAAREAGETLAIRSELPDLLDDLFKSAVANSGYEHGSVFEVFGSIIYLRHYATKPVPRLAMQVALEATGGKSGPDLIEFFVDGFGIVQFKSYSALNALLGRSGARDNLKQMITDVARMYDDANGPGVFMLPPGSAPDAASRLFKGDYVSVIDLRQFRDMGDDGLQALWNLTSGTYTVVVGRNLTPTNRSFYQALGDLDSDGNLVVTSLDTLRKASARNGEDPAELFVNLLDEAKQFQAYDMERFLPMFNTRASLQTALETQPEMLGLLNSIVGGSKKAKAAGMSTAQYMADNGVELFFRKYGPPDGSLPDGWLTNPSGTMFEINPRVIGMEPGHLDAW